MMSTIRRLEKAGFLLLALFASEVAIARAKVIKPQSKKSELHRATLYDTQDYPISQDTVRTLSEIEAEALASLARTEGYEGVARVFRNDSLDYALTASWYAQTALEEKLRLLDYCTDVANDAATAHQAMLDAQADLALAQSYSTGLAQSASGALEQIVIINNLATESMSSFATTTGYQALALASLTTITSYQSEVGSIIDTADITLNAAAAALLYSADTTVFNAIMLSNSPAAILKAAARALESVGNSISNIASNGLTSQENLAQAATVILDAGLALSALIDANAATSDTLSAVVSAQSALAVAVYDLSNATNADASSILLAADAAGGLANALYDMAYASVNDASSIKDIADGYSLLAIALENIASNNIADAEACRTVMDYAYQIAVITQSVLLVSNVADVTIIAPAALLASEVAMGMQAVALNPNFAQASNFCYLQKRLLRALVASTELLNATTQTSFSLAQDDIDNIGDSAQSIRNVIDLLVVAWQFGSGESYQNNAIAAQDVIVTAALNAFTDNSGNTLSNLQVLADALVAYAIALQAAVLA